MRESEETGRRKIEGQEKEEKDEEKKKTIA
jgi:hypothetical protein